MSAEHYCDECGKKMKRTANVSFIANRATEPSSTGVFSTMVPNEKRNIDRIFPWQIFAEVEI